MKINLLEETQKAVAAAGHTSEDIIFIGSLESGEQCSWEEFRHFGNMYYDNGYGGAEIRRDLVLVFKDNSILRRGEYAGSEWWEFIAVPELPSAPRPLTKLTNDW